ncbi:hypothetical protein QYE76_066398 [Lolium multiflorum]|uniref:Uncharacterized protein n=1 Tax=Lolium multiflorum TaxID=4521 RepID=A0AAD8SBH1_LOLMU|nr:hypothetical protein QYE76_066398 [Lolium multiflorum]
MELLDGSDEAPPKTLKVEDTNNKKTTVPNSAYGVWLARDQAVLSFLVKGLDQDLLSQVIGLEHAHQVWSTIEGMFISQSRSRVNMLRGALANTKKNDLTVAQFISKMRGFASELAAAGKIVDDDELKEKGYWPKHLRLFPFFRVLLMSLPETQHRDIVLKSSAVMEAGIEMREATVMEVAIVVDVMIIVEMITVAMTVDSTVIAVMIAGTDVMTVEVASIGVMMDSAVMAEVVVVVMTVVHRREVVAVEGLLPGLSTPPVKSVLSMVTQQMNVGGAILIVMMMRMIAAMKKEHMELISTGTWILELTVLKELYNVRCTLRGEALVKFDFLMDSLKEKDESIEELEYHLNDKERRFNLLRQELKTERCISQGLKQQIETYELDKVKDLETIERAQSLTQELNASKEELEVAHASLTRDLDHLERANKLVKDELKKLGENHDLLQETYSKALESMNDPIIDKDVASSSTSFTSEHAKLVAEHVRLQEELSLHVETNTYLESLVTKYGLNYYPNESACEHATTLEENVRLKKELAKFITTKNKMGLDDLLSKQRSNNQKHGLGYVPKPYKKNNYKKEKPAQEKNKKVTNDGKAPKGKATSGDRTGPNNHYALFIDYYGDVYANFFCPRNGYAYRGYSIWVPKDLVAMTREPINQWVPKSST